MSPKRKKLEAALDSLFSSARKPAEPSEPPVHDQPLQSTAPLPASQPVPMEALASAPTDPIAGSALPEPLQPTCRVEAPPRVPQEAPAGRPEQPGDCVKRFVLFKIAGVSYALDIACVESIIKMQPITAVPHAHPWVEGVTNLRGTVLPVINLRSRFGVPVCSAASEAVCCAKGEWNKNTRIMIAVQDEEKVGIVVDEVSEVMQVPADGIEPPPPIATGPNSSFITGVAKTGGSLTFTLDLGKLLSI